MKPMRVRLSTLCHISCRTLLSLTVLPATLIAVSTSSFGAKAAPTLTFNVAARIDAKGNGSDIVQSTNGRVFLKGQQARLETKLGEQGIVVLFLKPYVYRLLPSSKAGVRYKGNTPSPELEAFFSNWPALMNQPNKIRAALQGKGAKKAGTATLNGVATDVYIANRWDGKQRPVKLWLRRSDSLPVRLESSASGAKITLNWSNYRRGTSLSPSLFAIPKGYKIRDGQPPRAMG